MDICEYKGILSFEDFAEGITAQSPKSTLGTIWEHTIDCNHCSLIGHCKDLASQVSNEYNYNICCRQVIDFLLGDKSIEDIVKEVI